MASGPHIDYDGAMARDYDAGRGLPEDSLRRWIAAAAGHLSGSTRFVLDLGAGTGRFSAGLAAGLRVGVIALEPAAGMRERAKLKAEGARVFVVAGRAEAIPVRSGSMGMVWASRVLHHVADLPACAWELRRVLIEGGRVLVRGSFNPQAWALGPYFRGAAEELGLMPRLDDLRLHLAGAGLGEVRHEYVKQVAARSGDELLERAQLRADSVLARLPDAVFRAGLQQLSEDVSQGQFAGPVTESIDLVAFAMGESSR